MIGGMFIGLSVAYGVTLLAWYHITIARNSFQIEARKQDAKSLPSPDKELELEIEKQKTKQAESEAQKAESDRLRWRNI